MSASVNGLAIGLDGSAVVHFGHGGASPYELALTQRRPTLILRPRPGGRPDESTTHIDAGVVEVGRFLADADRVDRMVLSRTRGSVLDIGSGPGRMVAEAMRRGRVSLGIDVSPAAVALARASGRPVLLQSVFDAVPDDGHWSTALLLDGNVGIGGDPGALLARCAELITPGGTVAVETDCDPERDHRYHAELVVDGEDGDVGSDSFPWAHVGTHVVESLAVAHGLVPSKRLRRGGRQFVLLRRAGQPE